MSCYFYVFFMSLLCKLYVIFSFGAPSVSTGKKVSIVQQHLGNSIQGVLQTLLITLHLKKYDVGLPTNPSCAATSFNGDMIGSISSVLQSPGTFETKQVLHSHTHLQLQKIFQTEIHSALCSSAITLSYVTCASCHFITLL